MFAKFGFKKIPYSRLEFRNKRALNFKSFSWLSILDLKEQSHLKFWFVECLFVLCI
jgi:hypothetical protein